MRIAATTPEASKEEVAGEGHAGVLFFGNPTAHGLRAFEIAAESARMPAALQRTARDASAWLEHHHPAAIVVDVPTRDVGPVCLHWRENPRLCNVPVIVLVDVLADLGFEELFGAGGDDLALRGDAEALARRFGLLAQAGEVPVARVRGTAIVADADRRRRVLLARVLRNAGYSVAFASDAAETLVEAGQENVELVVSAAELEADLGPTLAGRARDAGVKAPWVVSVPPKETARLRSRLSAVRNVATYDAFGPCENLLFVANELMRGGVIDARASARLLYGVSVRFRRAGGEADEIGYTYNVSAGGLYVRTLAPLPRGLDAWIELRPPRCDRRVRLEGRVVWARAFGPNDSATVPPGFGLQVVGSSLSDMERYVRSYRAYAADVAGS